MTLADLLALRGDLYAHLGMVTLELGDRGAPDEPRMCATVSDFGDHVSIEIHGLDYERAASIVRVLAMGPLAAQALEHVARLPRTEHSELEDEHDEEG